VTEAAVYLREHPRVTKALQFVLGAIVIGFCVWAVRSEWSKAGSRIADANLYWLAVSLGLVAVYYLTFILGWIRMLRAWDIRVSYRVALQAEMVSMLAKYVPGGVWTPAARAVALRRNGGITDTPTVLASILVEAGLSAISGVIVFVLSLAWVHGVDAPLPLLIAFGLACAAALHPRVFRPLSRRILKPFGAEVEPLPFGLTLALLLFYCATWVVGGLALYFMLLSVHANPGIATVAFLGGVSAVGAIVAVLAVFSPSGLGFREGAMYGLLLAVVDKEPALSAALLNRLTITVVEVALFGVGVALAWRLRRHRVSDTEGV
jgi:glycosyltransferase 2 family protein